MFLIFPVFVVVLISQNSVYSATFTQPVFVTTSTSIRGNSGSTLVSSSDEKPVLITIGAECSGCQIAAEFAPLKTLSSISNLKVARSFQPVTSSIFSAYTLTSSLRVNGVCQTTSYVRELPTPFTVTRTDSTADEYFLSSAINSFADYIGLTQCQGNGNQVGETVVSQVPLATKTTVTLTSANSSKGEPTIRTIANSNGPFNSSNTAAATSPSGLGTKEKFALGISIPIGTILCCVSLVLGTKRYRKNKRGRQSEDKPSASEEDQPYLQQKGELTAEEIRRFELENHQSQNELDGSNEIHEMPGNLRELMTLGRQELRSEEHCKEMGDGMKSR